MLYGQVCDPTALHPHDPRREAEDDDDVVERWQVEDDDDDDDTAGVLKFVNPVVEILDTFTRSFFKSFLPNIVLSFFQENF